MRTGRVAPLLFLGLAAAIALAAGRAEADSTVDLAVATDSREDISQHDSFGPTTARIYVIYKVTSPKPAKVKIVWIADKIDGVPSNSKMNESVSNLGAGTFMSASSNVKPGAGWPLGSYKVEVYVDDKLEKTVRFKVTKTGS